MSDIFDETPKTPPNPEPDRRLEEKLRTIRLNGAGLETRGVVGRRLILIADEVGPGAYALDQISTLHPAQSAIVCLTYFRGFANQVSEEFQRREILKQYDEIMKIMTGKKEEKKEEPPK